ncbi:MAG: nucleotide exchange factor GrpE [Chloroflexota bacterium]
MSEEILEQEEVEIAADNNGEAAVAEAVAETADLTLEEQLAAVQEESTRNLDGWRRAQAELANARKRFDKQRAETYTRATADLVSRLLPVLDDLDRALDNVPETIAQDSWFEGLHLVQRKLLGLLDQYNVEAIEALGHPFDPNLHEAIMQEPSDEYDSGVVCRELQKGYRLGEQIIRPSLVYVAE